MFISSNKNWKYLSGVFFKYIIEYGFSIKFFGEYCPICISAQHKTFRKRFLPDDAITVLNPINAREIFSEDDYIK